ncbi:MAG TPA: helix-turn-helix transcriptional regulator [Thermoanaerobaculia bacterium]|nr:helix-turn-helix transcriptional regulator [Thermoanaerobaculia bacterium]
MSDLAKYVKTRAARDPEFADGLESGYTEFKVGALLRQARENAGLTQEQVADRLETKKSAISRIENSAGSIRFSTLERYARAIGWQLALELRPPGSYVGNRSVRGTSRAA